MEDLFSQAVIIMSLALPFPLSGIARVADVSKP
jgi:hypothetical protein